jgi:hypothetical protein
LGPTNPIGVFYFDQVFLQEWDAQVWIEGGRYVPLQYILDFFGRDDPDEG